MAKKIEIENKPAGDPLIGRRQLLKGLSGLAFMLSSGVLLGADKTTLFGSSATSSALASPWVYIDSSGRITIYNPVAEMGQGSATALPLILAEELDADWDSVTIKPSAIDAAIYGHNSIAGHMMMLTVGSYSVRGYFDRLRLAGAQIRQVLLFNASVHWGVPMNELKTDAGVVLHAATGKQLSYGEIAGFGKMPSTLPEIDASHLKSVEDFRLIGKSDIPRRDIASKVDGSAVFSMDIELPAMQYGVIQRAPVNGSVPQKFNKAELESLPGITAVIAMEYGVGIVGTSYWAVMKARKALQVSWSQNSLAASFNSSSVFDEYGNVASLKGGEAVTVYSLGDVEAALASDANVHQADYKTDLVYHAQMEPLNAVARVDTKKQSVELWVGSQFTSGLRDAVAKLMSIPSAKVTIHPQFLGGGFGRRSWHDFGLEAVQLSLATSLPVKLIWSREDDLKNGAYRPATLQRMQASINTEGVVSSWKHRTVGDNAMLLAGGAQIPFYNVANQAIDYIVVPSGLRTKHWRAVAYGQNKFAIECFVDEVAGKTGKDSYNFRRDLLKNHPRALKVLDAAVVMSPWGKSLPSDRALGLAFAENVGSLTAGVVEISLNHALGKIQVHRVWAAIDAGIIVQPENAIRQTEGAIIQGLGSTLFESITVKNGEIEQSNFHDYKLMKMADVPEIHIQLIKSNNPPGGIGEAALPFAAAAVGNAFSSLTGKRLRHLPFLPERVKSSLSA